MDGWPPRYALLIVCHHKVVVNCCGKIEARGNTITSAYPRYTYTYIDCVRQGDRSDRSLVRSLKPTIIIAVLVC